MALTAYSKYRLYVTRTPSSAVGAPSYVTVNTFSGFANVDGTGTDLFVGGTASASSTYPSAVASRAFDANSSTEWSSQSELAPQWLRIDLASPVVVRNLYLAATANANEVPRDFRIEGSTDGTNWTTLVEVQDWVVSATTKTEGFRADLLLAGTSLLDTGVGCSKVFVSRFDNGQVLGEVVPNAVTGAWSLRPQYSGSVLVTHIGPTGYRPMADGPVTPIAE
jgi:hypothetical protein